MLTVVPMVVVERVAVLSANDTKRFSMLTFDKKSPVSPHLD